MDLRADLEQLAAKQPASRVSVDGWVEALEESSAGRVVAVHLELRDFATGELIAIMTERSLFVAAPTVPPTPPPRP